MANVLAKVTQPVNGTAKIRLSAPTASLDGLSTRETQLQKISPFFAFLIIFFTFSSICVLILYILVIIKDLTFVFISNFSRCLQFFPTGLSANFSTLSCQYSVPGELGLFSMFSWLNQNSRKSWSPNFVFFFKPWKVESGTVVGREILNNGKKLFSPFYKRWFFSLYQWTCSTNAWIGSCALSVSPPGTLL